jgi:hypothetical protein
MAILFFRYRDRLLFRRNAFRFLRPAPKVIVQARSLMNQNILVRWESLNYHSILNIRPQSFVELSHLSTLIPMDPRRILRESGQILGYRGVLL